MVLLVRVPLITISIWSILGLELLLPEDWLWPCLKFLCCGDESSEIHKADTDRAVPYRRMSACPEVLARKGYLSAAPRRSRIPDSAGPVCPDHNISLILYL
ncbi:hypothetical protein BGW36DRAFT_366086 [Talaromyces proteolyticus]|uniref:Uncharacterized protein n=1 Tax=Talaromyces proteolyticus TaxID=1131652 RepID=A0AAD4KZG3_9EURO|nr:uncharacterized protein BGW36DRAFT_366086 [Talaromyces proteolyticus]KAH8704733.1 hypothetical protein BGW36DRAFT_366086 [Talaromyces proteolyticus]